MTHILKLLTDTGWRGHLITLLAGGLITLSLAPFKIWPLSIVALMLFALGLEKIGAKQAILRGWLFGAGMFGSGASWVYVSIHIHGNAPVPLAVLLTALFCGGLALCISLLSYPYVRFFRGQKLGLLLALPTLWVLGEWFRCWFLTGFPWLFLGYTQVEAPLAGWAPLVGTLGISWILAFSGCLLAQLCLPTTQRIGIDRRIVISTALALWIIAPLLNQLDWVNAKADGTLSVTAVQANIPQEEKWKPEQLGPTLQLYRKMSEQTWRAGHVDLIVWPETAIPRLYHRASAFLSLMESEAKKNQSTIITGIPYKQADRGTYHNTVVAFGEGEGIYHKQRLVPFGEYIPLEKWLRGVIEFFDLPMSNFSLAPEGSALLSVGEFKLAPFICYEVVYPDLVASTIPAADILITISNDTWFGKSHGPLQHMQMAQMRALENGRYLIRGTNNGVTAFINEKGEIIKQAEQFVQTTLSGEVIAMQGITPFSRWGSKPVILACFALLGLLLWFGRDLRLSENFGET